MAELLRIVQLNLAYDPGLSTPERLLAVYDTLTGWATAVAEAGAAVVTVQRYRGDASLIRGGSSYEFVADGPPGTAAPWAHCSRVIAAVVAARPDVVHVNGLMFPGIVEALRRVLPAEVAVVVQDHAGQAPVRHRWPLSLFTASEPARWQRAYADLDACTFTAADLAVPWKAWALPAGLPILEIPEAGTSMVPHPRAEAAERTGVRASPVLLWVGRLDENKDPLTVLAGLELVGSRLPGARLWMIYGTARLEQDVRGRIARSPLLAARVTLVGRVGHQAIADYFSAADIFISGSHREGSGYALLEALACGVMPCVTDIPAFRALAGPCGSRWAVGDAVACAAALLDVSGLDREAERDRILRHHRSSLAWKIIGERTVAAYRELAATRRRMRSR
ncbi:MAG: glycosyltransferase family 4 protein [Acidobacteriota bacterium]